MIIIYSCEEVEKQCTSKKAAKRLFGGDEMLAVKLLSRINMITAAETLRDIVVQKSLRFHKLENKGNKRLEGLFAIDVKSIREPWRLIVRPLDSEGNPYNPCHIDEISDSTKTIEITEVGKHYE